MVQLQFLNYILSKKDISAIIDNNLDENYFPEYVEEYNFIKNHYDEYKIIPDTETFISQFPNFELLEVQESERYLVNTIREEYLYSKSVPVIKKAAELLKSDANEASRYLQSELINLTPNYVTPSVDIIHSDSRVKLFEDKSNNRDKWFIPTGFEELDDVFYGWQRGEEYAVVYARTNQGKSWIVCKMAQHAWLMGEDVGYVSPEMSADKIGYRFDTLNKHFSNKALLRGDKSSIEVADYQSYIDELSSKENRFLVTTPIDFNKQITVSKLRTFVMQNKLTFLVVDGITYLTDERYRRGDNKTTTLTNISEDLMQLSCELKIPILVVVQSNRGGVKEDVNATPELEDIRDSDGIAHNATKVISLRQKEDAIIVEVKKNRDGKVGTKLVYSWDIDVGEFVFFGEGTKTQTDDKPKETKKKTKKEGKVVF